MKNILMLIVLLCLMPSWFNGQEFYVYTQSKRYNIQCKNCIKNYYFFGQHYIDGNKKNIIDLNALTQGINTIIPNKQSTDLIVLDIENKVYQDVKQKSRFDVNYASNIKKLVDMVNLVKKMRPNAKVVLYGVPFNFNYDFQKKFNDFEKLKPLLKSVDYLAPSLYLMYSNFEKDDGYFKNYITNNLDLNFQMAEKVQKPVLPFIWYKVHPYNKISGGSVVNENLYDTYLKLIKDYSYKGKKVSGIIYWEPSKETININQKLNSTLKILDK
ncbi:hypothetical protein [Chryseobacterium sp. CP-77]|uniref:hypothetical protein n=1 Tax=Chryseobacterium sp. CP-77 TaxID=3116594 RepID=UPI002ED0AAF8